jgi:hypothetical protein
VVLLCVSSDTMFDYIMWYVKQCLDNTLYHIPVLDRFFARQV